MKNKLSPISMNYNYVSCPNCENENARLDRWHYPFLCTTLTCLECGFCIHPDCFYLPLTEVNKGRKLEHESWVELHGEEIGEFVPLIQNEIPPQLIADIDEALY